RSHRAAVRRGHRVPRHRGAHGDARLALARDRMRAGGSAAERYRAASGRRPARVAGARRAGDRRRVRRAASLRNEIHTVGWPGRTMTPDFVVIGGGPAGSTVSTLLAQQGFRVELFERERFPRFHIGESLIPETYWTLKRLNMLPKMQRSHFVKKYSVQFV